MVKSALVFILAALVAAGLAASLAALVWWFKSLLSTDRQKVREETLEARQAREDLELAVLREERRKAREL